ncbi:glutamate receptor ionotropic, kainate glr-3-like [Macrobrachium nipponense]|uniref:glutamate receptor ionotropic, kainate glr-3-like n=1 Tax=Macrobrachium nipponense TaxID=159736 RepID=UPI0030C89F36
MAALASRSEGQKQDRDVTTDDVLRILESFPEQKNLHLNLLYDFYWEDSVDDLALLLNGWSGGLTLHHHTGTTNPLTITDAPTMCLVLCSPQNILQVFGKLNERFKGPRNPDVTWLLVLENEEGQEIMLTLEGILQEGTYITLVIKDAGGILDVFYPRADTKGLISFEKRRRLNTRNETVTEKPLSYRRDEYEKQYSDMKGRELRVAANDNFGFCSLGAAFPGGNLRLLSGIDVELLKSLARVFNFTYRVMRPADGLWGNPVPNGTVSGMIGMVARREADLAVCFISVTRDRTTVVDFTYSYYRSVIAVFSRAPRQKDRAMAVLTPFTPQVWLCITLSILILGAVISIKSKVSDFLLKEEDDTGWNLQWNTFNLFRSLVSQGSDIYAKHWWTRIILLSWFVSCLTFSASYSGMLTAALAQPAFDEPVDSLKDLPKAVKEGFTLGVKAGTNIEYLFKEATEGIYKRTWELFDHGDRTRSFVDDNVTGMKRVLESDFLLIGMKVVCELLVMKMGRNKFHIGRDDFFPHSIAIPLPRGAPYREAFDQVMMRMVEGGLISKWRGEEVRRVEERTSDDAVTSQAYAITLRHLQAAFFILITGLALATVSLIVECTTWQTLNRRALALIK